MKSETFKCEGCGVLQLPRAKHPKWNQWVGHCDSCCEHSDEVYVNEGLDGRDVYVCGACIDRANERAHTGGW